MNIVPIHKILDQYNAISAIPINETAFSRKRILLGIPKYARECTEIEATYLIISLIYKVNDLDEIKRIVATKSHECVEDIKKIQLGLISDCENIKIDRDCNGKELPQIIGDLLKCNPVPDKTMRNIGKHLSRVFDRDMSYHTWQTFKSDVATLYAREYLLRKQSRNRLDNLRNRSRNRKSA